ncbi:hypothetical protein HA402_005141 [Bradysia odoriphaga]|nr:hypothetical protein HA402_005141 [Bradysia odoriphaga]
MKLAKISTEEEYYQLRKQLEESGFTTPFWLGGTKIDDPEFYWFGHNAAVSFTAWNSNEPNNSGGKESCIAAQPKNDYKWNDEDCSIQFYFICEGMVEQ